MEQFCREHAVRFETCGKIIVAIDEKELPGLERIHERGVENGVTSHWLDAAGIREIEPYSAGIRALHVPESGIVDYPAVCDKLSELLSASGHVVRLSREGDGDSSGRESSDGDVRQRATECRVLGDVCGFVQRPVGAVERTEAAGADRSVSRRVF